MLSTAVREEDKRDALGFEELEGVCSAGDGLGGSQENTIDTVFIRPRLSRQESLGIRRNALKSKGKVRNPRRGTVGPLTQADSWYKGTIGDALEQAQRARELRAHHIEEKNSRTNEGKKIERELKSERRQDAEPVVVIWGMISCGSANSLSTSLFSACQSLTTYTPHTSTLINIREHTMAFL